MFIVGGAILGVLVLGEPMTAKRALGMLLAIAGALLVATESASTPGAPANFDQVAYCASPLPNDQFSLVTSTRLMNTSSRRRPRRSCRPSATAL